MSSKAKRPDKLTETTRQLVEEMLGQLYTQAHAQFGDAIKSFWFHDSDLCPACAKRRIDFFKIKGRETVALNAFIHRERGVLIGYFLCATCAKHIFRAAERNPYQQTALHAEIERNLKAAYLKHLASLNA